MTVTIFPLPKGDLFTRYRPSKNAHLDFIIPGKGKSADKDRVKTIKLDFGAIQSEPSHSDQLDTLLSSIPLILAGKPTKLSYHHLSSITHKAVLPPINAGPRIYSQIKDDISTQISSLAREFRGSILSREGDWLTRLSQGWETFIGRIELLSRIFVYFDTIFLIPKNPSTSIKEIGISAFKKGIWENSILYDKTKEDILSWVNKERDNGCGESESDSDIGRRSIIIKITDLSKLLGTFESISKPYVENTISFYAGRGNIYLDEVEGGEMSPSKYVEWVLEKVEEERKRGGDCMSGEVAEEVVRAVRSEAGEKLSGRIVVRALDEAMDTADQPALIRLYRFSVDVHVFGEFTKALQGHIEARLRKLISDPANDSQMIEETLKIKRFADQSVSALFATPTPTSSTLPSTTTTNGESENTDIIMDSSKSPLIQKPQLPMKLSELDRTRQLELEDSIRNGLKSGLGSRQNAPAEWIAKHLDSTMRKGQGNGSESTFNELLDEIIALIGYTRDKDVFKAFYSTQLAKRLLLNKSASDDMERNMIGKLQKEMGEEFTSGDIMMKDLQLSETMAKSYQTALSKSGDDTDAANLTANVLTESAWPAYPLLKEGWQAFKLPPELQSTIDAFTSWYSTQHKNRQLSWRWQLATVTISARFASGKYEIGVSLFQAVVLLVFNDEDTLPFEEIKARTGIEHGELVRTLQSLSLGRKGTRVLLKKPPGKEVLSTDTFGYNKSFSSERIKFRINQIQQDLSAEESRKTNEQVAIDRVSVLEATIVRIMKARKKLTLQLLIDSVVMDVSKRFPPDVKEIKKRVESLIEREFLMRDEDDRNMLHYLA